MNELVKVAVDAMGGDNAPGEIVKGAVDAVNENNEIKVFLVGKENRIQEELKKYQYKREQIDVVNAEEEISCDESPVEAIRKKKDSSMVVAMKMVKDKSADAFVSAGSSGAILVGGQFVVGRIRGIKRSPLAVLMPTVKGVSLIIDCGANMDSKAEYLHSFAKMGSIYMEHVVGIKSPKVALVNVGMEEEKGNALVKETMPLLKDDQDINYSGYIEARDIHAGAADVIVCDAFVGNVILKLSEGLSSSLVRMIKKGLMSTVRSKIGAVLALPALKKTLKKFDATEYGGAPLLGLNGLVVKMHGNATAKETKNAIIQCITFSQENINSKIKEQIVEG
ncbi:MAG: phosphate acyltransferase PlsX [Anaerostipes sp.]|nr:phosphate acyltransferase PlsX [Anaerostipes sp.]